MSKKFTKTPSGTNKQLLPGHKVQVCYFPMSTVYIWNLTIKSIISFMLAAKKLKYLGINLIKFYKVCIRKTE